INATMNHLLPASPADQPAVGNDLGYINLPVRGQTAYTLTRGIDSLDSPEGYKGRMGIYEAFDVSTNIQGLILKRSTSDEIQAQAQAEGMVTMREDGYLKALSGQTTVNEINRVASAGGA
ncbi:MAG: type II/IV secretion system protein, partial [Candidatus Saccharimonadales bacterium]